jgi:GH35 family endo-1,4-beta-xylanase
MKAPHHFVHTQPTAAIIVGLVALHACTAAAEMPESYHKLWNDPTVAERIDRNIEKYRKADATIEVVDADGRAIADASLEVRQQTHAFLFGCNAFVLGQLGTPEANRKYEEAFVRLFNFASVPFYWAGTEPAQGELRYAEGSRDIWRRPPPDRFLPWAEKNGITLKGHPLLWHAHNPPWIPKDAATLKQLYQKRFAEIAERYGKKIPIWDVVNESLVCPPAYPLYTPDRDYVRWAFDDAVPRFPKTNIMMINEVTSFNFAPASNRYFDQIKGLVAGGADVRGIGFQYHYFRREAMDKYLFSSQCHPGKLLDVYERFGDFNVPLYITEITFPSAGEGGDRLQADVVRDHYRLWFSAPRMAGITWWNLGDGTAVEGENEAKGGLVDEQLEPKPAYAALDRLINDHWKTRLDAKTDARGILRFRGFCGKYNVKVTVDGKTQTFDVELTNDAPVARRLVVTR